MAFENRPISLAELPRFNEVELSPVERVHAWIGLVLWLLVCTGLVGVAALVLQRQPEPPPAWLLPVVITLALAQCVRVFAYRLSLRFALRSHDMIFADGLFWRSQTIQPLCRVQHVEIERGPIEKRFNLATLKLFSAGSSMATFAIPGLVSEDAERLRAFVLDYTAASTDVGVAVAERGLPSAQVGES